MNADHGSGHLPRHYLQACLLLLIGRRPTYGYTLRDDLLELGVDQRDWGQLYRTLRALEASGLVLSCWENSESGPSRRTYHLTDKGSTTLAGWAHGMAAAQGHVDGFIARYRAGATRTAPAGKAGPAGKAALSGRAGGQPALASGGSAAPAASAVPAAR